MNRINIRTNPDGTYDFQIVDAGNNEELAFSRQGYVNVSDAMDTARSVTSDPVSAEITFSKAAS